MKKNFKKFLSILLVSVMAMGLMTACGSDSTEEGTEDAKPTEASSEQIMFNGSTSLAPVISKIASNFNEEYGTWDKVDDSFPESDIAIYVSAGGSGQGAKAIIDGTSDFGMLAREIKDEEKEKIEDYKEYKVGIDALTIAVNPENPVVGLMDDLTKEQIVDIFSGKYKTWKDLDDSLPDKEIVVITRDVNGGAHEVFQKNIMGDETVKSEAIQAPSMGELVQNIIDNEWAIGYASYGLVNQNEGKVVTMKVDGVEPSEENILQGSYIIQRPLLLVRSGDPTPEQQAFLDAILGEEGAEIVEEMGFIPVK